MKLRKGDKIKVISGNYKGQMDTIKEVDREKGKVVLSKIGYKTKYIKNRGIEQKIYLRLDVSNVQFYSDETSSATRLGYKFDDNKKKYRYMKKDNNKVQEN